MQEVESHSIGQHAVVKPIQRKMGRRSSWVFCPSWVKSMEKCVWGAGPLWSSWIVSSNPKRIWWSVSLQILFDHIYVQNRSSCICFPRGLRIIREGVDYYLVHQGEIQLHLGSRRQRKGLDSSPLNSKEDFERESSMEEESSSQGILDRILFFIGDLEVASTDAKRSRLL